VASVAGGVTLSRASRLFISANADSHFMKIAARPHNPTSAFNFSGLSDLAHREE
jgi:hypothetical protein